MIYTATTLSKQHEEIRWYGCCFFSNVVERYVVDLTVKSQGT